MEDRRLYSAYLLLQWTWGILQNLTGLMLFLLLRLAHPQPPVRWYHGAAAIEWDAPGSMALGMFIFCERRNIRNRERVLVHEYGHTVQSAILGPFYLVVIGIPSLLWCRLPVCIEMRRRTECRYMDFYPEIWANRLGEGILHQKALWN